MAIYKIPINLLICKNVTTTNPLLLSLTVSVGFANTRAVHLTEGSRTRPASPDAALIHANSQFRLSKVSPLTL